MKKLKFFIPVLLVFFVFQSCNDNEIKQPKEEVVTVMDLVLANPTLSIFDAALREVNLQEMLRGQGPFTVLAPTDQAFTDFLAKKNFSSVQEVPDALLKEIVLNHVIRRSMKSNEFSTGYEKTMAISQASQKEMSLHIDTSDRIRFNGVAYVSQADMEADNGVMHMVDAVIDLPRVIDFVRADRSFSTLLTAFERGDLTFDFAFVLATPHATDLAPFTVFAPTNEAFENVLDELKLNMLSEIPEPTLKSTLNYHIVSKQNMLDTMFSHQSVVETLEGPLTVEIANDVISLRDQNNRVMDVMIRNIQADNGVIHSINKVILPLP